MEISLSSADAAFRTEVREFIRAELPGDIKSKVERGQTLEKDDYARWHKILFKRGWVAPSWPVEYGGTDWTPLQRHLFEEELAAASSPRIMPFGLAMVA
ncbi:MAG: acyl-CoA dehydrogenase family protein, partial [Alphaproteobacteria bacterium]|nr:acyl-CoA dehydrogenase family protein [Alphaproteobacteria bacterium]